MPEIEKHAPSMDAVFLLALLSAFCIGLSKAGFSGISLISVFLLADRAKGPACEGVHVGGRGSSRPEMLL